MSICLYVDLFVKNKVKLLSVVILEAQKFSHNFISNCHSIIDMQNFKYWKVLQIIDQRHN